MAEPALREPVCMPRIDPAWCLPTEAELPFDDGQPLADGDYQREPLGYAYYGLYGHYAARADVAVQSDMFVHYLPVDEHGEVRLDADGKPIRRMVAPDVFVVLGVPKRKRNSYVAWDEGKTPDFVLEVLSPSTWRHDIATKKNIYERMGVLEYWVANPPGTFVDPPLQGWRLVDGCYQPITPIPGRRVEYVSELLGLELRVEDDVFRIRDPTTGADLRGPTELRHDFDDVTAARREAEGARDRAQAAREQAEAAREQAVAARERAGAAREAAESRARRAEQRIAELEAQLRRQTSGG